MSGKKSLYNGTVYLDSDGQGFHLQSKTRFSSQYKPPFSFNWSPEEDRLEEIIWSGSNESEIPALVKRAIERTKSYVEALISLREFFEAREKSDPDYPDFYHSNTSLLEGAAHWSRHKAHACSLPSMWNFVLEKALREGSFSETSIKEIYPIKAYLISKTTAREMPPIRTTPAESAYFQYKFPKRSGLLAYLENMSPCEFTVMFNLDEAAAFARRLPRNRDDKTDHTLCFEVMLSSHLSSVDRDQTGNFSLKSSVLKNRARSLVLKAYFFREYESGGAESNYLSVDLLEDHAHSSCTLQ